MGDLAAFWRQHLARESDWPIHLVSEEPEVLRGIRGFAEEESFKVFDIDLIGVESKEDLWQRIAVEMSFPDYFGRNWPALLDFMSTLGWWKASGFVVYIRGSRDLLHSSSEDFQVFFELLGEAIDTMRRAPDEFEPDIRPHDAFDPVPYHVFVVGDVPTFELETAVGVRRVCDHREGSATNSGRPAGYSPSP